MYKQLTQSVSEYLLWLEGCPGKKQAYWALEVVSESSPEDANIARENHSTSLRSIWSSNLLCRYTKVAPFRVLGRNRNLNGTKGSATFRITIKMNKKTSRRKSNSRCPLTQFQKELQFPYILIFWMNYFPWIILQMYIFCRCIYSADVILYIFHHSIYENLAAFTHFSILWRFQCTKSGYSTDRLYFVS